MNSYDTMNPNYGYNRNNQGWQQPSYSNPGYRVQPQQPFNSNIMYVTSPEEALIKTALIYNIEKNTEQIEHFKSSLKTIEENQAEAE